MAVNKNFVVKNGLEVNTSLIFADAETDKVGIANTTPSHTLHVNGGIGATSSYVSGVGTFINGLVVSGTTGFNVGAAGSVGIGTNTANYPLEILGTSGTTVAQITGNVNVDGNLIVDDLTATQSVTSISTVTSSLHVENGGSDALAEIDILTVNSSASFPNLYVTGVSTFTSIADNALGSSATGSIQISGGVGISKNLTVGSAATIGSSLFVGGKSLFYNYSTVNNTLNVNRLRPETVSFASSLTVSSQETEPREVVLSNDGKTMYVLGNAGNDITYYGLTTAWSLPSASYLGEYSVASQLTLPTGMYFRPDGTKFYVVGTTGVGAAATAVNQYSCSTPWDLTTASYDSVSFSVFSQEASPQAIEFKPDGTKFYVAGIGGASVYQYSCSTPWDLTTASYDSVAYSLSVQDSSPQGIRFSLDGLKLLVVGSTKDVLNEYVLSTPWNVSTISFGSTVAYFSTVGETSPSGLYWKPDGSRVYASGFVNDRIYQFNVSSDADLEVIGETKLYGDVEIYQDVDLYGIVNGYGDVYLNSDLTVSGLTTTRNFYASGISTISNINSGQLNLSGIATISVNSSTNALRINQTGSGNALLVEDETNPDSTPFVINSNGNVGIATNDPTTTLHVIGNSIITGVSTLGVTSTTNFTAQQVNVSGISTLGVTSTTNFTAQQVNVSGVSTLGNTSISQLNVSGVSTLGTTSATNFTTQQVNVSGLSTFAGITTVTGTTLFAKQLNVSGVSTLGITTLTNLTSQQLNVSGVSTLEITNISQLNVSGVSTLGITTLTNLTSQQLNVSGVSTLGITTLTNLTSQQINVSGVVTATTFIGSLTGNASSATYATSAGIASALNANSSINTTGIITATAFYGDGVNITGVTANPGGSDGQIQYKNGVLLGGAANMYYDNSTGFVGIGSTQPTVALDIYTGNIRGVFKDYGEVYYDLGNTGTSKNINLADGNFFTATLTGSPCTFTFTTGLAAASPNTAVSFTLFLTNGVGSGTVAWPPTVWWPGTGQNVPNRTTTANRTDVYTFITYNNGAKWYGTISMFDYQ